MRANRKETITTSCIGLGRAEQFLQLLSRGNVEFLGRGHDHYHRKLCRRRPQTLTNPLYGLGLLTWFSCPGNAGAWEPGQPQETGGSHAAWCGVAENASEYPWGVPGVSQSPWETFPNVPGSLRSCPEIARTRFQRKLIICYTSATSPCYRRIEKIL